MIQTNIEQLLEPIRPDVDGRRPAPPDMVETLEIMGCLASFSIGDLDFATIHSMNQQYNYKTP